MDGTVNFHKRILCHIICIVVIRNYPSYLVIDSLLIFLDQTPKSAFDLPFMADHSNNLVVTQGRQLILILWLDPGLDERFNDTSNFFILRLVSISVNPVKV